MTGIVTDRSSIQFRMLNLSKGPAMWSPRSQCDRMKFSANWRNILENKLIYDEGRYKIDFEDLEEKLSNPQTTMMILCNPHNPVGKIWDRKR